MRKISLLYGIVNRGAASNDVQYLTLGVCMRFAGSDCHEVSEHRKTCSI